MPRLCAIAAMLLAAFPTLADDQPAHGPCGPFKDLMSQLAAKYHEQPLTEALGNDGALYVTTAAADGATWTMIIVGANGKACIAAAGTSLNVSTSKPDGKDT